MYTLCTWLPYLQRPEEIWSPLIWSRQPLWAAWCECWASWAWLSARAVCSPNCWAGSRALYISFLKLCLKWGMHTTVHTWRLEDAFLEVLSFTSCGFWGWSSAYQAGLLGGKHLCSRAVSAPVPSFSCLPLWHLGLRAGVICGSHHFPFVFPWVLLVGSKVLKMKPHCFGS